MADSVSAQIAKLAKQQRSGKGSKLSREVSTIAAQQSGSSSGGLNFSAIKPAPEEAPKKGVVAGILDILDRPGNAVRNSLYTSIRDTAEKQSNLDLIADSAGAFGRGLMGKEHTSTSNAIEKLTDSYGYNNAKNGGPAYKNIKDNVNPLLKGVAGFAGDVALDPTTYIPGADLISVSGKVVKGVKGGVAAAKAIEEGATTAEKVVAVAKGAAKSATAPSKAALAKAAKKAAQKVVDDEVAPTQQMLDLVNEHQAPSAVTSDPVDIPVAPKPDPVAPVKPETPDTPKALSREEWLSDAVSKVTSHVDDVHPDDIKAVATGATSDLTTAERRLAQRALDKNFGDKAYKEYLDHFQAQHVAAAAAEKVPADAAVSAAKNVDASAVEVASKAAPEAAQEAAGVAQQAVAAAKPMPAVDRFVGEFLQNARKGVAKTDEGVAYHANHIDQAKVVSRAGKALPPGWNEVQLSRRVDALISALKPRFDQIEESGIPLVSEAGGTVTPLRYDEVLQTLKKTDPLAAMMQVNKTGSHLPSDVMKAAQYVAMTDAPDPAVLRTMLGTPKAAQAIIGKGSERIAMSASEATDKLAKTLLDSKAELTDMVREKSKYWAERRGNESLNIANQELDTLSRTLREGTPGDYIEALSNVAKNVKDTASMPAAADDAAEAIARQVPPAEAAIADNFIKAVDDAVSIKPQRPLQAIGGAAMAAAPRVRNAAEQQLKELDSLPEELSPAAVADRGTPAEVVDFGTKGVRAALASMGSMFGTLRKFKMDHGTGPWAQVMQGNHGASQVYLQGINKQMNAAVKTFGKERLTTAFKALQNGTPLTDPTEVAAVEALRPLVEGLWRKDADSSLVTDAFLRVGANLQELNRFIPNKAYHLPVDDLAYSAAEKGTSFVDEAAEHWRSHDISDPVDYLMTMHQALTKYTAEASVPRSFEIFAKTNGLTSKVAKPGFAKVTDTGGSIFAKHMDKDLFYDKESLQQMQMVERLAKEFRGVNDVAPLIKNMDAIMNEWKVGMTSMRLGFHIRNFIGDMFLTHLDGALSLKNSRDALKVLGAHKTYDGMDIIKSLRQGGVGDLPGKGERLLSLKMRGGKQVHLTNGDIYALAQREGLLQDFSHLEGIINESSNTRRVLDNLKAKTGIQKVQNAANTAATAEAHYTRLVHLLGAMKQGAKKFDNIDSIAEYAAKRVKKFHPDPSMLSPFEMKYMRRLIPFYSWQRAMIPVIAESLLTRPGRFMVYPKASYNTAVALGVDPYSIAQPFPPDQQFPSFIANQATGPVAKIDDRYWSISPGIAQTDVLSDYAGANPIRTVAGSLNPAIKTPIELLTGKNLQTGGNIKDPTQYLLGQVPGVNYASKAVTNAGEADTADGDPTANSTMLLNWVTGIGAQNLSKPSYQKYAAYEQSQNGGDK